jgi:hypothetical protein
LDAEKRCFPLIQERKICAFRVHQRPDLFSDKVHYKVISERRVKLFSSTVGYYPPPGLGWDGYCIVGVVRAK